MLHPIIFKKICKICPKSPFLTKMKRSNAKCYILWVHHNSPCTPSFTQSYISLIGPNIRYLEAKVRLEGQNSGLLISWQDINFHKTVSPCVNSGLTYL